MPHLQPFQPRFQGVLLQSDHNDKNTRIRVIPYDEIDARNNILQTPDGQTHTLGRDTILFHDGKKTIEITGKLIQETAADLTDNLTGAKLPWEKWLATRKFRQQMQLIVDFLNYRGEARESGPQYDVLNTKPIQRALKSKDFTCDFKDDGTIDFKFTKPRFKPLQTHVAKPPSWHLDTPAYWEESALSADSPLTGQEFRERTLPFLKRYIDS